MIQLSCTFAIPLLIDIHSNTGNHWICKLLVTLLQGNEVDEAWNDEAYSILEKRNIYVKQKPPSPPTKRLVMVYFQVDNLPVVWESNSRM